MARRRRYGDRRSAGSSQQIPYVPGEGYRDRHSRRLVANSQQADAMQEWCAERGIKLTITNGTHHWTFRGPRRGLVEWWPSSGKLVINKRWRDGTHVHDWTQVQRILERELRRGTE